MYCGNNADLLKEMKQIEMGSIDVKEELKNMNWEFLDVRRCRTPEEIKLLTDLLAGKNYDTEDKSYIVEDAVQSIAERNEMNNNLAEMNAELKRNAKVIEEKQKIMEEFDFVRYKKNKSRRRNERLEDIEKMTSEQMQAKLNELSKSFENLKINGWGGVDCSPSYRKKLEDYVELLKEAKNFKPEGARSASKVPQEIQPTMVLKALLLERAEKLNMSENIIRTLQNMTESETDIGQDYAKVLQKAKVQGIPEKDKPAFIRKEMMPEICKNFSEFMERKK